LIHMCDYALQPVIRIKCTQVMTTPHYRQEGLPPRDGVHWAYTGDLYTFDEEKVTCPECSNEWI